MKYLSLFTGIGGFELAIHEVFSNAECAGWSEIDKFAIQTYVKNFPSHEGLNFGDIERLVYDIDSKGNLKVNEFRVRMLPDFDLLVAGSPCQDLSINKAKRQGLLGKKSRLFFCFLEILKIKKPKYFILENVASMSKENKLKITELISKAYGREIKPMLINSNLISAQNRERLYWFPWQSARPVDRKIVISRNGVTIHAWSKSARVDKSFDERIRVNGKANSLTCSIGGTESIGFFPNENLNFVPRKVWKRSELFYHKITADQKLTSNECEFLQTFPKDWTAGVSECQRYRQLGNAVTVKSVEHILKGLDNQLRLF